MRRPRELAPLALVLLALPLAACKEVETADSGSGYEPAKVEPVKGDEDLKRVTFTADAARRVGLRTTVVTRRGDKLAVPYAALIYDEDGAAHVYTVAGPLSFLRTKVEVADVGDGRVLMTDAPPAGTKVVTRGAAEVYGAELEIAGSH